MAEIYFDITDLIAYASAYATVSGIQRVEVRLLAELARIPEADNCWCVAVDRSGRGCVGWRLADVMAGGEHEDVGMFSRLADGILGASRRNAVRRRLNQLGVHGWRRAVGKVGIYSKLLFDRTTSGDAVPKTHLSRLPRDSTFVVLGAGWNHLHTAECAAGHARAGGRVVQCVYDLIPIVCPDYFENELVKAFSGHLARAAECVSEFICISHHTQRDLEQYLRAHGHDTPSTVMQLAHEFHGYP